MEQKVVTYRPNFLLAMVTLGLGMPWATTAHRFKRDAERLAREGWYIHSASKLRNFGSMVVVYHRGYRY